MKKIIVVVSFVMLYLAGQSQLAIGSAVPEISLPDTKDQVVSLSSLKGKVVLIDFWASWCRPCRLANPGVVKLYNKYKAKGFEVFGVSIDDDKLEWIKAIKKDKITYSQVNDNSGFDSKILSAYMIDAVPTTFLLDKQGNLVVVDPEGKKLEKLVKQLL